MRNSCASEKAEFITGSRGEADSSGTCGPYKPIHWPPVLEVIQPVRLEEGFVGASMIEAFPSEEQQEAMCLPLDDGT